MLNFAFIFARGGSKGLPGKNIKPFNGKPLIAHAIDVAMQSELIDRVFVSTDSQEIAEFSANYGAEVPFLRPSELAQDSSPEWLSWKHACEYVQSNFSAFDTFISLPTTAPLRLVDDVARAIQHYQSSESDTVITTVEAKHNPYFTMVKKNALGEVELFSSSSADSNERVSRRQDAPEALGIVPVAYVTSPEFILSNQGVWDGSVSAINVDPLSGIDIDDKYDFYLAELVANDKRAI